MLKKLVNVITSKPRLSVQIRIYRRARSTAPVIIKGKPTYKYGPWEYWVSFRGITVNDKEECTGWIKQFLKMNASPHFAYRADVNPLGWSREKAREKLDGSDRPFGNHKGVMPDEKTR